MERSTGGGVEGVCADDDGDDAGDGGALTDRSSFFS